MWTFCQSKNVTFKIDSDETSFSSEWTFPYKFGTKGYWVVCIHIWVVTVVILRNTVNITTYEIVNFTVTLNGGVWCHSVRHWITRWYNRWRTYIHIYCPTINKLNYLSLIKRLFIALHSLLKIDYLFTRYVYMYVSPVTRFYTYNNLSLSG